MCYSVSTSYQIFCVTSYGFVISLFDKRKYFRMYWNNSVASGVRLHSSDNDIFLKVNV